MHLTKHTHEGGGKSAGRRGGARLGEGHFIRRKARSPCRLAWWGAEILGALRSWGQNALLLNPGPYSYGDFLSAN